jgi:hypothetical protein
MLNLEILIFFNVILKLSLKKSIISLYNLFIMIISLLLNKITVLLLNKICLSCIHDEQIFILKITGKSLNNIFNNEFKNRIN